MTGLLQWGFQGQLRLEFFTTDANSIIGGVEMSGYNLHPMIGIYLEAEL